MPLAALCTSSRGLGLAIRHDRHTLTQNDKPLTHEHIIQQHSIVHDWQTLRINLTNVAVVAGRSQYCCADANPHAGRWTSQRADIIRAGCRAAAECSCQRLLQVRCYHLLLSNIQTQCSDMHLDERSLSFRLLVQCVCLTAGLRAVSSNAWLLPMQSLRHSSTFSS